MQIILLRSESKPIFSQNFCMDVIYTPPLGLSPRVLAISARDSILRTSLSCKNFFAVANSSAVCVSKSSRSTIITMVGLLNVSGSRSAIIRERNSIVYVLPQPVAPKYVPPLPSPAGRRCRLILSSIFPAAKNCG